MENIFLHLFGNGILNHSITTLNLGISKTDKQRNLIYALSNFQELQRDQYTDYSIYTTISVCQFQEDPRSFIKSEIIRIRKWVEALQ